MLFDSQSNPLDEAAHGFPVVPMPPALCKPLLRSAFTPPFADTVAISAFGRKAIGTRTADGLIRITYAETKEAPLASAGPGTELKKLLALMRIHSSPTCGCNRMAAEMNRLGPEWCLANIDKIVAVMEQEAKNRKLPFLPMVARALVRMAVRNSNRTNKALAADNQVP